MNNLRAKAKELLSGKAVQVVIGYEAGTKGKTRPAFITDPEKTDKLIFTAECDQNLAVYLTKPEIKAFGKMAIVATLPVMRSIMVLESENQVLASDVVVLGISPNGEYIDLPDTAAIQAYIEKSDLSDSKYKDILEKLSKLSPKEKFAWWQEQFAKCIRCYACRQACPMCYCTRCAVEVNQPQWVPVAQTAHGNMDWHILRAMHLAGRCIGCGECGRACPVGIPCHLLTMHLSETVSEYFHMQAGTSQNMKSVMSTYDPNDKENFIV
jgi:ferredoxin